MGWGAGKGRNLGVLTGRVDGQMYSSVSGDCI